MKTNESFEQTMMFSAVIFCLSWIHVSAEVAPRADALIQDYPRVRMLSEPGGPAAFFGHPMTAAQTPEQAAQWWLDEYAGALGDFDLDLRLAHSRQVGVSGRWVVLTFEQFMEDAPVEFGTLKIVVMNGSPARVVMVSSRLVAPPGTGFGPDLISVEEAQAAIRDRREYADFVEWTSPELVVYDGSGDGISNTSVRAWKFQGANDQSGDAYRRLTFFVNAADGRLEFVRNEVHRIDVTGTVHGLATPWGKNATYPDDAQNPPVEMAMEDVQVQIDGDGITYANDDGTFVLPNEGDADVLVEADLIGPWVRVINDAGAELHLAETVTPPGPVDFVFNSSPAEFTTAQVNAMIHVTSTHDFYTDRQPDFDQLGQILVHVNPPSTCGAFWSGNTITLYRKGFCPNAAYSTVIAHEYGHYIVDRHFLGQGAFGEGYGDAVSILQYDDPIIGRDFLGEGVHIRDTEAANEQYPCNEDIFTCGMVLSGVWWDARLNLNAKLGEDGSLAFIQQLFTDWTEITIGGSGSNAVHPVSAVEVLTADDDDGDITNGTPNSSEICSAFAKHGIDCPRIACDGDANADGVIDPLDAGYIASRFRCDNSGGDPDCPAADVNEDGIVDPLDVGYVMARFGECS